MQLPNRARGTTPSALFARPHGNIAIPSIVSVFVLALVVAGYLYSHRFLSPGNLISIGQEASAIGIGALGMTYLIGAGFFDLSGSGIVPLAALMLAIVPGAHGSILLAVAGIAAALMIGALAGAMNGFLVAYARIPAFVATLGSLYVYTSIVDLITGGNNVAITNPIVDALANGVILYEIPVGIVVFLIFAVVFHFGLWHQRIGRYIRLIGVNQKAAFVWGIPVQKVVWLGFCLSGITAATGSLILGGMFSSATASMALNFNLNTIAAVVIGGTRLEGGQASLVGTFVGALTLAVITNFLTLIGVSPYLQYVLVGGLLVLVVGLGGYDSRHISQRLAGMIKVDEGPFARSPRPQDATPVADDHAQGQALNERTVQAASSLQAGVDAPLSLPHNYRGERDETQSAVAAHTNADEPLLAINDVWHSYVDVPVLRGVNLMLKAGECVGLIGQNGAGKSTIINILSGRVKPTKGQVVLRGREVTMSSPRVARDLGIAVVAQELDLMPTLSVADNIILGTEPLKWGVLIDRAQRDMIATEAVIKTGVQIDIHQRVEELTAGEKQLTEVARGIAAQCNIIILDEPTSSLSAQESERLMTIIEELKRHGCGVIFVSHKFGEVFRVADQLCILRDGAVVGAGTVEQLGGHNGVAKLLIGRTLELERMAAVELTEGTAPDSGSPHSFGWTVGYPCSREHNAPSNGASVLAGERTAAIELKGFTAGHLHVPSFIARYGEIVGIGGVEGSGGTELMEALAGLRECGFREGRIGKLSQPYRSPATAAQDGIIFLPPERKEEGIFFDAAVAENVAMGTDISNQKLLANIWWRDAVCLYDDMATRLSIKAQNEMQPCGRLSGGNQQKALFGRAIASGADIWLLAEPTRGIDVGARAEIYRLMREEAAKGKSIIVRSIDPAELSAVCSRCYVLSSTGTLTELSGDDVTSEQIYAACYRETDSAGTGHHHDHAESRVF